VTEKLNINYDVTVAIDVTFDRHVRDKCNNNEKSSSSTHIVNPLHSCGKVENMLLVLIEQHIISLLNNSG
jgi:hypothetical protein